MVIPEVSYSLRETSTPRRVLLQQRDGSVTVGAALAHDARGATKKEPGRGREGRREGQAGTDANTFARKASERREGLVPGLERRSHSDEILLGFQKSIPARI